jgi:hypothetical protein
LSDSGVVHYVVAYAGTVLPSVGQIDGSESFEKGIIFGSQESTLSTQVNVKNIAILNIVSLAS